MANITAIDTTNINIYCDNFIINEDDVAVDIILAGKGRTLIHHMPSIGEVIWVNTILDYVKGYRVTAIDIYSSDDITAFAEPIGVKYHIDDPDCPAYM